MKIFYLATAFLISSLVMGQQKGVLPPANVKMAFEKQFPNKTAIWSIGHEDPKEDITFKAKFNETPTTKAYAVYDGKGVFKVYKTQIQIDQLPFKAQLYLKKEYPAKPAKQILLMIDAQNEKTYKVEGKNNIQFYDIVFNKEGEVQL
jgi:hypothetical protein